MTTGGARHRAGERCRKALLTVVATRALVACLVAGTVGMASIPWTSARVAMGSQCSKPLVIGVAGSGEKSHAGGYGQTVAQAVKRFRRTYGKPVEAIALAAETDYPAAPAWPLDRFVRSVKTGIAALTQRLVDAADGCEGRPIVLIGYSQGAAVINRTLVKLDVTEPSVLDQIVSVELIADPQRIGGAVYTRGSANSDWSGLTIELGLLADDDIPADLESRIDSFCTAGDTVCATKPKIVSRLAQSAAAELVNGLFATRTHETYYLENGVADAAGKTAAGRLKIFLRARRDESSDSSDGSVGESAETPPDFSATYAGKGGPADYGIEGTTISYIDLEWSDIYSDESGFVAQFTDATDCATCWGEDVFIDANSTSFTVEIGVPYHAEPGDELCFRLWAQFDSGNTSETPKSEACLTLPA